MDIQTRDDVPNLTGRRPPADIPAGPRGVRVVGFDMPFVDMIVFMVKWALASIPAALILLLVFGMLWTAGLGACLAGGAAFHRDQEPVPDWLKKK